MVCIIIVWNIDIVIFVFLVFLLMRGCIFVLVNILYLVVIGYICLYFFVILFSLLVFIFKSVVIWFIKVLVLLVYVLFIFCLILLFK